VIAGSLLSTWEVHEKVPFRLTDFAGAPDAAATLGLTGPYWVGGGAAHAVSRKTNRSNGSSTRAEIPCISKPENAVSPCLKPAFSSEC
jgi:hypothetical protein